MRRHPFLFLPRRCPSSSLVPFLPPPSSSSSVPPRSYPESDIAEEYHLKTHWKIILVGSRGAGMFNHSDSLLTSSWHAHLMGSKWW